MKNETVIQDYLFSSALLLKTIAILITWYALHAYAGLAYERNFLTRLLVQNDLTFLLAEVIALNFLYAAYSKAKIRISNRTKWRRSDGRSMPWSSSFS